MLVIGKTRVLSWQLSVVALQVKTEDARGGLGIVKQEACQIVVEGIALRKKEQ
jgi:hypothetical protein